MWFSQEDGSKLCDFELEPGAGQHWGCNEQTDELRRVILYLVHENNSMLVKLRGLSALREVLQSHHETQKQDLTNFTESSSILGAENSQELAGAGAKPLSRQTQGNEKFQEHPEQLCFANGGHQQDVYLYADCLKVSCFDVLSIVTLSPNKRG